MHVACASTIHNVRRTAKLAYPEGHVNNFASAGLTMPPPPAAMIHSQPSKGACLVPDNRRQLEQQDRAYKKAKLAAASSTT